MFTRLFPVILLLANGLVYLVLAWLFIDSPRQWFANLGISLEDEVGYTELRTMYIGVMASLGLFFLLAVWLRNWRIPALSLALISYSLLAIVRAWGLYVEDAGNAFMQQLLISELVSALAAAIALVCLRRAGRTALNPSI